MSDKTIIFFLVCLSILLFLIVCYQRFVFGRGIQDQLSRISAKLSEILDKDSDEKVMVFTDNKVLKNLIGQINRMLLDRQRVKADYRKQEVSMKKMLANISHDIKTPLTVILGYLEIMQMEQEHSRTKQDDSMQNDYHERLQKVAAKAEQVMELINQFFTLAKLESGDLKLTMTRIAINELCRENILGFYDLLLQRAFDVELSIPEQNFYVQGDKDSIDRILNNLLSNAIRYGSDGNYLGLFLREEADFIAVDIVDRGRGIEKAFADSIFERLYTLEDSRNRQIQGNGLGLTIAKNLARQMGGDLLLESEPGRKTVFTVRLQKMMY